MKDYQDRCNKKLLESLSVESIDELKKDYHYSLSNKKLIEGIVLDLFDTCFLAFDERENDK